MTKKPIGQGAGQFAPTSQFGFFNRDLQPPAMPDAEAEQKTSAKLVKNEHELETSPSKSAKTVSVKETARETKLAGETETFRKNEFIRAKKQKLGGTVTYNLDKETAQGLRIYAVNNRMSASKIVNDLVAGFLAEKANK